MAKKLTKKQRGFIKDYIKTGNGVQSVLKNYDTKDYSTAGVIAVENLEKPKVIEAIKSYASRLPDELLEKVHLEGLAATRTISLGQDYGTEEVSDHPTRSKFLDLAYKVKGMYAPERHLNVNIDLEPSADIKALADRLNGV